MTKEEITATCAIARRYEPSIEVERLILIRDTEPEIFAQIPAAHRAKVEPYIEKKQAYERLKTIGIDPYRYGLTKSF